MIDSPPKIVSLAVDLHEHLIQMPTPSAGFHARNTSFSYLRREQWTEPMPPKSHSFMADIDATFVEQIFHIAKGQRETNVHHNRQADDLTARFEIAKWVRFGHLQTLRNRPARLKSVSSDRAHIWTADLRRGKSLSDIAAATSHSESYVRTRAQLAFLAPKIQKAILVGSQPPELTLEKIIRKPIPLDWDMQARIYGFSQDLNHP